MHLIDHGPRARDLDSELEMAENIIPSSFLAFLLLYFVFSSHFPSSIGAASFTRFPPNLTMAPYLGTVRLVWNYTVDNKNEFKDNSPIWEYKGSSGWQQIASEDGLDGWKWKISNGSGQCPPHLLTRVSKESRATLVINNAIPKNNGRYRCTLKLISGDIPSEEVQLLVEAPVTTPTPSASSVPSSTTSPSPTTTSSPTTTTTSSPTTTKPTTTPSTKKIPLWVIIVVAICGVSALVTSATCIGCCCFCPKYLQGCWDRYCCCCPCKCFEDCCNRFCSCCPCKIKVEGSSEEQESEMKSKPPSAEM